MSWITCRTFPSGCNSDQGTGGVCHTSLVTFVFGQLTVCSVLLLSVAEVVNIAIEELVAVASEMTTPFTYDTRYQDPRDCMPKVQLLVNELRFLADELETHALEVGAGLGIFLAQSTLKTTRFAKSATWSSDQVVLETLHQKATSWNTSDYPGLSYVLQMKLFRDQPHLLNDNVELFLLYREGFLLTVDNLFNHLQMHIPTSLKTCHHFIPSAFASIPTIASRLRQRNVQDCLGRSVSHILYDAKSLKEWSPDDMRAIDSLQRSSLYLSCCDGNHDRLLELVRSEVSPSVEAANGLFPLDIAVISGDLTTCATIWKMEVALHELTSNTENPVCVDTRYGQLGARRRSPMMWAAFAGHVHIMKFFKNYENTYPNATAVRDSTQSNAIGLAAMRGKKNVIEYLSGYPCHIPDAHGRSPLWYAASIGHVDIFKFLCKKDMFPDRQDNYGYTPLAIAAHKGYLPIVDLLLGNLVDISIPTNAGHTALYLATSGGHLACVKLLLPQSIVRLGASKVWSVYAFAQSLGHQEICRAFEVYGLDHFDLHHAACSSEERAVPYIA